MIEKENFWKSKTLKQMTNDEWESLCDGCGKCCLHKLEDIDTGEISVSNVSCMYLDLKTCGCMDYKHRHKNVKDCIKLTPETIDKINWLPNTCSYKLVLNNDDLPDWHHLVSGDKNTIHERGMSVKNFSISEKDISDVNEYILDWFNNNGSLF
tara:strand:+ start:72 stop:530 length:459 start_codon:yes stop_codon:yes gene_type:complete